MFEWFRKWKESTPQIVYLATDEPKPAQKIPATGFSLPEELRDFFPVRNGFVHPEWTLIRGWIAGNIPAEDRGAFYTQIAREWLRGMQGCVRHRSAIYESQNFLLLCTRSEQYATTLFNTAEEVREKVIDCLDQLARTKRYGKHVIIQFHEYDDFIAYYRGIVGEEHFIDTLGGVAIKTGYMHIAIPALYPNHMRLVLSHEIAHILVAHQELPKWLDEALAYWMHEELSEFRLVADPIGKIEQLRSFWSPETIQMFWRGNSFSMPDGHADRSAELALLLLREIMATSDNWKEFLEAATQADSGAGAAQGVLGRSLGVIVAAVLGQGDWEPKPSRR